MPIKSVYNLEKLKKKNKKKYKIIMNDKEVHKILTCKTSEKCVKYLNRDVNATKNMVSIVSILYKKQQPISKIFVIETKICDN